MFEGLEPIFRQTYNLAVDSRIEHDEKDIGAISLNKDMTKKLEELRNPDPNTAKYKLDAYLNTLDFETIKILQTIMYLGRDKEYSNLSSGIERYKRLREYFDRDKGWNTKTIEIRQMTGKVPFAKYLHDGFKILGITV